MTKPGIETGPDAAKVRKRRGWGSRRLVAALIHLLRQGLSPQKLALGVSLGIGIGCFPVLGTTTLLCTLVAFLFRMNLPAIQAGNLLAWPLQLVLLVPFMRLGERLFHASGLPLSPQQIATMMRAPGHGARTVAAAQVHAVVGWLVVMPWVVALLVLLLRPLIALLLVAAARRKPAIPG